MITKQDVFDLLKNAGIRQDDKVTIHCSLRAIGGIEHGADGLIDAFCEYLHDGLFIVPTHTWNKVWRKSPCYDVRTTVPDIGTLAEVAAFRKDGIRSLHPTHSVAVFGKGAADFVRGEEKCASPAPPGSCISRLYEENGKVLLVGVGHERNTYLHSVDERLKIPDRLNPDPFEITITDYNGNTLKSPPFHTHFTAASDQCVSEYYPNYKAAFEYTGAVTYSRLGNALVYVCDCRKMTDTCRVIWERTDRDLCISAAPIPAELYEDLRRNDAGMELPEDSRIMLETKRLLIRRFRDGDARELYENHNDEEVRKWFPNEHYADPEEALDAIRFFADCVDQNRLPFVLGVELKETGELIGDTGASEVEGKPDETEIGYCIGQKYRGKGYATELLGAISGLIAARFGVKAICGRVVHGNDASVKVLEKNGYRFLKEEFGAEDDPYGNGMLVYRKDL